LSGVNVVTTFARFILHDLAWQRPEWPNTKYGAVEDWMFAFQLLLAALALTCGFVGVGRGGGQRAWIASAIAVLAGAIGTVVFR
jgi:hypothetical protein